MTAPLRFNMLPMQPPTQSNLMVLSRCKLAVMVVLVRRIPYRRRIGFRHFHNPERAACDDTFLSTLTSHDFALFTELSNDLLFLCATPKSKRPHLMDQPLGLSSLTATDWQPEPSPPWCELKVLWE
jgi:hypothetical protein